MTGEPEPCSLEAERAVLGAVLLGNGLVVGPLMEFLQPGHFYWSQHRTLWAAMADLHRAGRDVDALVLAEHLGPAGLAEVGGREAVDLLAACTPNWSHFMEYGRVVHQTAQWRRRSRALHRLRESVEARDEAAYSAALERAR